MTGEDRSQRPARAGAWLRKLGSTPGAALLDVLGAAARRVVADEAALAERLAALEGRTVAIGLRGAERRMLFTVSAGRIETATEGEDVADVSITGSVEDFVAYVRAGRRGESAGAGRIEISGDLQTAQSIQSLLAGIDLDPESALAEFVGDVAAHQIGRAARAAAAGGLSAAKHLERDLTEYLTSETSLVPTRREVEAQARAAFALADDVARAEARLARLEGRRK